MSSRFHLPVFLSAVAALTAHASAQVVVAVNDTRDLADADLIDGVIDADLLAPGEQRTLRACIEQICNWGGAWRVVLPAQTLVLNRWGADEFCHWGDLDIFSGGAGLTQLVIEGTPGLSALDASGFGTSSMTADRVFDVQPSVASSAWIEIRNVRLVNGLRPGAYSGGGIQHLSAATLRLNDVDVVSCSSGNGGGIFAGGPIAMTGGSIGQCSAGIDGGGLFVAASTNSMLDVVSVVGNSAVQYGGGVFVAPGATLGVTDSQIDSNDAQEGGGIRSRGALTLTDCSISGNTAAGGSGSGGNVSLKDSQIAGAPATLGMLRCGVAFGVAASGAGLHVGTNVTAVVSESTFEFNAATTLGGGLSNQGTASVATSTFNDNDASSGAGAYNFKTLSLRNCTFAGNEATTSGGGLDLSGLATSRCTIDACTIARNRANQGGGVYLDGLFGASLAEIKNSLLGENTTTSGALQNCAGTYTFTSHGFNVDTDGTAAFGPADYSGTLFMPLFAALGPLQSNGGPTKTLELLPCSAALCRADTTNIDGTANSLDQRLFWRDTPPDAGSFDTPTVTIAAYCTAGTTTNGCNASMSATGSFAYSSPCALQLVVTNVEGQRQGVIFYGVTGPAAIPWDPASTSFLCVKSPTQRTTPQNSGGLAGSCSGNFYLNFTSWMGAHPGALGAPFWGGGNLWIQAWFRDPPAPKTTNLSDAVQVPVCP